MPSNGPDAQLPACGNVPLTTTNAPSHKLPDSAVAGQLAALLLDGALVGEENVDEGFPPLALDEPLAAELALEPKVSVLQDPC